MVIRTFHIIYKVIIVFLLLMLIFLLSVIGVLFVKHDNLPINTYLSRVFDSSLDGREIVVGNASILPFISTGFRLKLEDVKILDKDVELVKIDTALLRVSLLSLFLGKPSINAVSINKIALNKLSKDDDNFSFNTSLGAVFESGKFLKDFLDSFHSYFSSAGVTKFKGVINQLCFFNSQECFGGIKVFSSMNDINERMLFVNLALHETTLRIDFYMDNSGLSKFDIVSKNFDSILYGKFFGFKILEHVTAKKLELSFKYNDNMHIYFNTNNLFTNNINSLAWLGIESISNGNINAEILNNGIVVINDAEFISNGNESNFSGVLDFTEYRFLIDIYCDNTEIDRLYKHMPKVFLADLYEWLDGHVDNSIIKNAVLSIDLSYNDWRNGDYTINDLYFNTDFLDSTLRLDFNKTTMIANKINGHYSMHYGGSLISVNSSSINNANVNGIISIDDHNNPILELSCVFDGNVKNVSEALLRYSGNNYSHYKSILDRAKGFSTGSFLLSLSLDKHNELWFMLESNFKNVIINNFIEPVDLKLGDFLINASLSEVSIEGSAILAGADSHVKFFSNDDGNKLNFHSHLSSAEVMKIPIVSNIVNSFTFWNGDIDLNFTINDINNNGFKIKGNVDFIDSDIDFIYLNLNKKKGDSALLKFSAETFDEKVTLNFGNYTTGMIELLMKEGFFYLDRIEYFFNFLSKKSEQYDFEFLLNNNGNDALFLKLDAKKFDGRLNKLFHNIDNKKSDNNPIEMIINIDNLLMYQDILLQNFSLESKCNFRNCEWFNFNALINDSNIDAGFDGERLCGKTDYINLLAAALNMGSFINKGQAMFCIDSFLNNNTNMLGRISASDFHIKKGGLLSDALSADKSLEIVHKKINKKPNQKIVEFEHMHAKFMYDDRILQIKNGVMYGPFIGVTFNGAVNFESSKMDFTGSLLPAYGINSIMAKVPVFGEIMAGGRGGVIGIDYSIKGDLKHPVLNVNPLSIFVPGILRNFFDIFRKNDIGIEKIKKNIKNPKTQQLKR